MLRAAPTHIVEIATNLNSSKANAPLIENLQHHHLHPHRPHPHPHPQSHHQIAAAVATAGSNYHHYHEHHASAQAPNHPAQQKHSKVYQLQSASKKNKLKKSSASKSSSSSSSSGSTNTSLSSSDESKTSSPLTFKEHFLSRGLLSASPFAFMRLRKASKASAAAKGAPAPAVAVAVAPAPKALATKSAPGYIANILSSSSGHNCSSKRSDTSIEAKNIYNTANNNYITSLSANDAAADAADSVHFPIASPSLETLSGSAAANSDISSSSLNTTLPFLSFSNTVVAPPTLVAVAVASPPPPPTPQPQPAAATAAASTRSSVSNTRSSISNSNSSSMSPTSQTPPSARTSLFDSCHRKIRLIGGGPVAFLGGLVAKARRKERDGDQNSTDTKLYLEESVLERKLPEADLKALVDLPAGLDYNEWLASHTLALFEHVNLVYGTISEFCTTSGCPDMTGPANRTYLWFDEKGKKTRVAAPQYIDYVMTFTQKTVSDESIFPTKYANEFPSSFESIARKILRLQFHVIAHLYAAHFREIALLGLHTHLNLTFAHLTALHRRFNLIDEKETDVLRDLEVALRLTDETSNQSGGGGGAGAGAGTGAAAGSHSEGGEAPESGKQDDVNSVQHNNALPPSLIDGGGVGGAAPICTQPEAGLKSQQFGGGGGLIGGILGDLSSGEFGDTMHYCTSAVPAPSSTTCSSLASTLPNATGAASNATNGGADAGGGGGGGGGGGAGPTANGNNGAGALHFHPHNNNNHVAQHHHPHGHHHGHGLGHHHPHAHPHHHHHHHPNHYAPNTGLIQCNASNAPTAAAASTSTTTA